MTDVHTPAQRSYNMSRIRGKDTQPEKTLRSALWRKGLRYRKSAKLPGRPDIVFLRAKVVVFVDGCFWHGCPKHIQWPKNNAVFWKKKILKNRHRDKLVTNELKCQKWTVVRIWEHDLKHRHDWCVAKIVARMKEKAS